MSDDKKDLTQDKTEKLEDEKEESCRKEYNEQPCIW